MSSNRASREQILQTLRDGRDHDPEVLLRSFYELRYHAADGDEKLVYPYLDHPNDAVAASALFSLWHTFDIQTELTPIIKRLAKGDRRDRMEMPVQSMAITLLGQIARSDSEALDELREVAEDLTTNDVPRKRTWQCLAEIVGIEWLRDYSEEMIMSPESKKSDEIRNLIRSALQRHDR